eukprot:c1431_g1_i1 orf=3-176(-)
MGLQSIISSPCFIGMILPFHFIHDVTMLPYLQSLIQIELQKIITQICGHITEDFPISN